MFESRIRDKNRTHQLVTLDYSGRERGVISSRFTCRVFPKTLANTRLPLERYHAHLGRGAKLGLAQRVHLLLHVGVMVVVVPVAALLQARLAPVQLDGVVVRVAAAAVALARRGRRRAIAAQAALLHRDLDLVRHEDVELQVAQHRPEDGQRSRDDGDVDLEGCQDDGCWAVPRRVEGRVRCGPRPDDGSQAPDGEDTCTVREGLSLLVFLIVLEYVRASRARLGVENRVPPPPTHMLPTQNSETNAHLLLLRCPYSNKGAARPRTSRSKTMLVVVRNVYTVTNGST